MLLDARSKTPLADAIRNEVKNKKRNYAICITGKTQMRKSTTAIKLALEITKGKFDLERDMAIVKTMKMLKLLNEKGRKGLVNVLDELGVGMPHRRWMDFLNQAMSFVMQTYGFRRKIVIITVPYEDYVDIDARKLFDMLIEVLSKNDKENYCLVKVLELQYNSKLKKMYYKFPRIKLSNGRIIRAERFRIAYPPEDIMKRYFEISNPIKDELGKDLEAEARKIEKEKRMKYFDPKRCAEKVLSEIDNFTIVVNYQKQISKDLIAVHFGIGEKRARQIRALVEQKLGWYKERPMVG